MDNSTLKPWELVVDQNYYRDVLKNMGFPKDGSSVRFGTEGKGVRPNYQIAFSNGEEVAYRGDNHEVNKNEREYNPENLSDVYDYQGVQGLLSGCIERSKK